MVSNSDGECYSRIHGVHWSLSDEFKGTCGISYKCKGGSVSISLTSSPLGHTYQAEKRKNAYSTLQSEDLRESSNNNLR